MKFVLVGAISEKCREFVKKNESPNVEFTGFLDHTRLLDYYQKAKVYCQLSTHESFGVAIVEAMCCECIPVVTRKSALPEIVEKLGFYVPYRNPIMTVEAIRKAMISDWSFKVRERAEKCFSLHIREKKLIKEILELVNGK